jgi:hypothetical protein
MSQTKGGSHCDAERMQASLFELGNCSSGIVPSPLMTGQDHETDGLQGREGIMPIRLLLVPCKHQAGKRMRGSSRLAARGTIEFRWSTYKWRHDIGGLVVRD